MIRYITTKNGILDNRVDVSDLFLINILHDLAEGKTIILKPATKEKRLCEQFGNKNARRKSAK